MSKLNKIISVLMTFCCSLLLISKPTYAVENLLNEENSEEYIVVTNEFEALFETLYEIENNPSYYNMLSEKSNNEYSQLVELREDYIEFLYSQKELSVEELKSQNYTDEQIEAIKNYDGSYEMSILASANLVTSTYLREFYYNSNNNRTYVTFSYSGYWNGSPNGRFLDEIQLVCVGSASAFLLDGASKLSVTHSNGTINNYTCSQMYGSGAKFRFPTYDSTASLFRRFSGTYYGMADGKNTMINCGGYYAHYNVAISGGLSVGISVSSSGLSAGFSFSFNGYTTQEVFNGTKIFSEYVYT